jgi:signal transduction histidine kinase
MRTISDHILDIVQNSIKANAKLIEIIIEEDKNNDLYTLIIKDNGCGMDEKTLEKATHPFFTSRSTRKVGLGLSLLKQKAEGANGFFSLQSALNEGTEVKAVFQFSNIDRPPLGEIWDVYYFTLIGNKNMLGRNYNNAGWGTVKTKGYKRNNY